MSIDRKDPAQVQVENELAEVLECHGMRLIEAIWRKDPEKETLHLAVKVSSDKEV